MDSASKRRRARQACMPCRLRKRKCDGDGRRPCRTCTDGGYACHYDARARKRPSSRALARLDAQAEPAAEPAAAAALQDPSSSTSVRPAAANASHGDDADADADHGDDGLARHLQANSGAWLVRKLGMSIDATRAPKLNLFGWNIGARHLSTQPSASALPTPALSVVDITSREHLKSLADVYFKKVDPCYGFIDRRHFLDRLDLRWSTASAPSAYDSVLAGVAAIGCLFSQRTATITELHLVRSAKSCLDDNHLFGPPSLDVVTGWALRTIYLRITDSPHSTWLASATLVHLAEAAGIRAESPLVFPSSSQRDPDIEKRLMGVAHHLNAWASFDLGLPRVSSHIAQLPLLPSPNPGDYTLELLALLPVSVSLDPGRLKDGADLTATLSQVLNGSHTQPPSVMAQCNLSLCILRRIHSQGLDISAELAEKVLALLKKALGCARDLVMDCSPWHQVANVPFQIICVLLMLDTRSSLAMLPEAMQTLSLVASTYDTKTMREAQNAAYLLVLLHQQRRKDDIAVLGDALNMQQQEIPAAAPGPQCTPTAEDYSWLGALVADFPGLQRDDFDQFLSADVMHGSAAFGGQVS